MAKTLLDRVAGLEQRHSSTCMIDFRVRPAGLSPAEQAAWHAREVAPLERAGRRVLAVHLVCPGEA